MALIITSSGGNMTISSAVKGNYIQSSHKPDAGKTATWDHDTTWWMGSGGDISSTSAGSGVKFSGSNGKDHNLHAAIGHDSGVYPSTQINGFSFKANQNSGAGHGLYIRRWGYKLRSKTSSTSWFYGVSDTLSRGDYGTKSYSHTFVSDAIYKLSNGYVFEELHLQASTVGGSGSRSTEVSIYDFKFDFVSPPSGKKLIVPKPRSYSDRKNYAIA